MPDNNLLLCPPQEGSRHPAQLVHISPHGHWRRVPETAKCNCTGHVMGECLSCLCARGSSDAIDATPPATPPSEREPAPSSSSSSSSAEQAGREKEEDREPEDDNDVAKTKEEEKKAPPSVGERISVKRHPEPYMTRARAEAEGYKIIWYDPEEDYNPLYFGTSPEDIARSEESRLDPAYRQYSETGWRKHITSTALLEYAGIGVGAVVAAGAIGVGFLASAAGIAVGCTVQELSPYYRRMQRNVVHDLHSAGWMF